MKRNEGPPEPDRHTHTYTHTHAHTDTHTHADTHTHTSRHTHPYRPCLASVESDQALEAVMSESGMVPSSIPRAYRH